MVCAYMLEAVMVAYVPAEAIVSVVGGEGLGAIVLGALFGAPAYLNEYAAAPLVASLMEQGMRAGAAMAFVLFGGMTCMPAMAAVWALVRLSVSACYLGSLCLSRACGRSPFSVCLTGFSKAEVEEFNPVLAPEDFSIQDITWNAEHPPV